MASKRRLRRRSCDNKVAYPTKQEAEKQAASLSHARKALGQDHRFTAYKCHYTSHWHVAHKTRNSDPMNRVRRKPR